MSSPSDAAIRRAFALGNLGLAAALSVASAALPVRYWAVDVPSALLVLLALVAAVGLLRQSAWSRRALRVSAVCELTLGLVALSALALSVSYLGGVYGEIGRHALGVSIAVGVMIFPYLVIYPALQLLWLHAQHEPPKA